MYKNIKLKIKPLTDFETNTSDKLKQLKIIILRYKKLLYNKPINFIRTGKEIKRWAKKGTSKSPPQPYRHKIIKMYAKGFSLNTFIETGTYLGNTVNAVKSKFKEVYSIELNKGLYLRAKQKFTKDEHINFILGDSSEILPEILSKIESPCLFWLDAHYSGENTSKTNLETPIVKELQSILNHPNKNHIILIDDAHHFTGKNDYPTIPELKEMINQYEEKVLIIKEDIIRIHKKL